MKNEDITFSVISTLIILAILAISLPNSSSKTTPTIKTKVSKSKKSPRNSKWRAQYNTNRRRRDLSRSAARDLNTIFKYVDR